MVNAIFSGLISFFLFFVKSIGNLIMYPIQIAIIAINPDISSFISSILGFFDNSFFPICTWLRMSLLNICCCPPAVWSFIVLILTTRFVAAPIFRSLRLLYNIYKVWKGTQA